MTQTKNSTQLRTTVIHQANHFEMWLRPGLLTGLKRVWNVTNQHEKNTLYSGLPSAIANTSLLKLTSLYLALLPVQAWMSGARAFWVGYVVLLDARWSLLVGLFNAHRHRYGIHRVIRMLDTLALSDLISVQNTTPLWGGLPWMYLPRVCIWPLLQVSAVLTRVGYTWKRVITPLPLIGFPVPWIQRWQLMLAVTVIPTIELLELLPRYATLVVRKTVLILWACIPFHTQVSSFVSRYLTSPLGAWSENTFRRSYTMYFRHRWIVPWSRVCTYHLTDVAGHQELVYEFHKAALVYRGGTMLVSPPTNSGLFRMMRSLATRYLLIGPAGSGKRMLAHATAADSRVPLLRISCEALLIGDLLTLSRSSEKVRAVFELARAMSPCVLLVEGIDHCSRFSPIGMNELNDQQSSSLGMVDISPSQLLVLLLREITELKWSGVFLIATTSTPSHIDRALLRKRRFTRVFFLHLPTWFEREGVFQSLLRMKGIWSLPNQALQSATKLTAGCTCSELAKLANEVLISCIRMQTREANVHQVQAAFYKLSRGATKRDPEEASPARNLEAVWYRVGEAILQHGSTLGDRSAMLYLPSDPLRYRFEALQRTFWETPSLFTTQSSIVPKLAKCLAGLAAQDVWLACSGQHLRWESLTKTLDRRKDVDIPQAYDLWQTLNDKWPSIAFQLAQSKSVHYGAMASEIPHTLPIQPDPESLKDYLTHLVLRTSSAGYRLTFSMDPMFCGLAKDRELWTVEGVVLEWFLLDPSFRRSRLTDDEDALQWIESSRARQRAVQPIYEVADNPSAHSTFEPVDPELFESDEVQHPEIYDPTSDAEFRNAQKSGVFSTLEQMRTWSPLFEWEIVSAGDIPARRKRVNESYHRLFAYQQQEVERKSKREDNTRKRVLPKRMARRTNTSIRSLWLEGRSRLWEEASAKELRSVDLFLRMTRLIDVSTPNLRSFSMVSASQQWGTLFDPAWTDCYRYGMIQDVYGWDASKLHMQAHSFAQMVQTLMVQAQLDANQS